MKSSKLNLQTQRPWALITGASRGIGKALAMELAGQSCRLILTGRDTKALEKVKNEIEERWGSNLASSEIELIALDLAEQGSAQKLFEAATKDDRKIQMLFNNAGLGKWGKFTEISLEDQQQQIKINMLRLTELSHLFIRHMDDHEKTSHVVNIASVAAFFPISNFSVYAATKSFVLSFSESLREELIDTNIRVSVVCPGGTKTDFFKTAGQSLSKFGDQSMMSAEEVAKVAISKALKGQGVIVPGALNQVSTSLSRFLPNRTKVRVSSALLEKSMKPSE